MFSDTRTTHDIAIATLQHDLVLYQHMIPGRSTDDIVNMIKSLPLLSTMNMRYLAFALALRLQYNLSGSDIAERFRSLPVETWQNMRSSSDNQEEWLKSVKETVFTYVVVIDRYIRETQI